MNEESGGKGRGVGEWEGHVAWRGAREPEHRSTVWLHHGVGRAKREAEVANQEADRWISQAAKLGCSAGMRKFCR